MSHVEHLQVLKAMYGFFEPRKMLRSFEPMGVYCLKLVSVKRVHAPGGE